MPDHLEVRQSRYCFQVLLNPGVIVVHAQRHHAPWSIRPLAKVRTEESGATCHEHLDVAKISHWVYLPQIESNLSKSGRKVKQCFHLVTVATLDSFLKRWVLQLAARSRRTQPAASHRAVVEDGKCSSKSILGIATKSKRAKPLPVAFRVLEEFNSIAKRVDGPLLLHYDGKFPFRIFREYRAAIRNR